MMTDPYRNADNLLKLWALTQVRNHVPMIASHLHYRDCPDIEVYTCTGSEDPLSDATPDIHTSFAVTWGCPHSEERMPCTIYWHDTLGDLINELADLENASVETRQDFAIEDIESDVSEYDPLFAANYPAPGGAVWQRS
jgi:hypothetical protein